MAFPLTEEQKNIVDDKGGELLVSAAAGSGKTRVLVERLMDRVEAGADIDRFLVITFTKAAAAELRGRIALELSSRLAERPGDRHLRRQTTLVYRAQISTIHSFCTALLRENGHLLDLDPDFRLCDEGESRVMQSQVLEEVLDRRYEGLREEDPFARLADTMAAGRDDSKLAEIAQSIFRDIQSHPDPRRWLEEQRTLWELEGVTDLAQTSWGALLLEDTLRQAEFCREQLCQALKLAEGDELLAMNYVPSLQATLDVLEKLCKVRSWDQAAALMPVPFPDAGKKRKRSVPISSLEEAQAALAGECMKALREQCKGQLKKLNEWFDGDSAAQLDALASCRPAVQALIELVMDFQAAFGKEKRRRGVLDFSDLEHFAARLLQGEDGAPTALAEQWGERYDEVLVDEYQDTNQVQNAIFWAISQKGRKLFQVGDVKQSIYRFRLADPTIFLEKYHRFLPGDQAAEGEPRKRVLSQNFRSRPQVLEGCNDLFRSLMSQEFGELDYTGDQALVPGKTFDGEGPYALELDALDLSFLSEAEGERAGKDLLEARFAARRVRELLDLPLMVEGENGGQRPVLPSDFMLLLRSPGPVLHHYIRALGELDIPWSAEGAGDIFETTEVNVALAILQIVDNPRQDVPLLAALRSPVYGFSGDKLALLRADSGGDFYTALTHAAGAGDEQCKKFLEELEALRFGAGDRTCRQLIWYIYEKTNLLGIFGAMDRGGERQENLLALYALAGQLEEGGCRSLYQFLLRLERLRGTGQSFAPSAGREGDGVSLLSIHRSKGLEKPVVLVCGLSRRINRDNLMRPVLFHPELGVGPRGLDRERMVEYPTAARRAVARKLEREMMAEELRLLYVAMTRAREKLILTLALPEGGSSVARLAGECSEPPIPPLVLERQQSVGAWVILHALTRPEGTALQEQAGVSLEGSAPLGPPWDIRWVRDPSLQKPPEPAGIQEGQLTEPEEGDWKELSRRLSWTYPHLEGINLPSKLTATQIKGRVLDQEAVEEARTPSRAGQPITRPSFIAQERGLTPAQQGTAIHLAMQYLPLGGGRDAAAVGEELDRLVQNGFLTQLQREAVQPRQLAAFLNSGLGQAMAASPVCRREFKFSILTPASAYFSNGGEEELLLQGVVDAWFEEEDGVTIVDFKSDRVSPGGERSRAEEYRPQLDAYSSALSTILNRPVKRRVLWFFATDTPVEL